MDVALCRWVVRPDFSVGHVTLVDWWPLKMEVRGYFETSGTTYPATWLHTPQDSEIKSQLISESNNIPVLINFRCFETCT